ncbi:hypothetical protein ACFLT7_03570 [candidate division KSB1 bacterium]
MPRTGIILRSAILTGLAGLLFSVVSVSAPAGDAGKIILGAGGGFGSYAMGTINRQYVDLVNSGPGFFDGRMENGPNYSGMIGFFLSDNVSVEVSVSYLGSRIEKSSEVIVTDEFGSETGTSETYRQLASRLIAPELRLIRHWNVGPTELSLGAGLTRGFGWLNYRSEARVADASVPVVGEFNRIGAGLGWSATAGVSRSLLKYFSLELRAGYRRFVTEYLTNEDGVLWEVDLSGQPERIDLDFSGPYLVAILALKL